MKPYAEDELLMLSGIQHFAFCERQWALIHIEQQWAENVLTVEGQHMHERVDNPFLADMGKHLVVLRSVSLVSGKLGLYGMADVVEFLITDSPVNSIQLKGKEGFWQPVPIEYKRGKPKPDERDEVQLCAQAICLEEMHQISIGSGYLFYGETRHRHEVVFDDKLRNIVISYSEKMHCLFQSGTTPAPIYKTHCKSCSLQDVCMPRAFSNSSGASAYLNEMFNEEKI
jgi:CRISPR-associated exonuclease Cas4